MSIDDILMKKTQIDVIERVYEEFGIEPEYFWYSEKKYKKWSERLI